MGYFIKSDTMEKYPVLKRVLKDIRKMDKDLFYFLSSIISSVDIVDMERDMLKLSFDEKNGISLYLTKNKNALKVFSGCTYREVYTFLIMHEALHLFLSHFSRREYANVLGIPPILFDMIIDETVNTILFDAFGFSNNIREKVFLKEDIIGFLASQVVQITNEADRRKAESLLREYKHFSITTSVEDKLKVIYSISRLINSFVDIGGWGLYEKGKENDLEKEEIGKGKEEDDDESDEVFFIGNNDEVFSVGNKKEELDDISNINTTNFIRKIFPSKHVYDRLPHEEIERVVIEIEKQIRKKNEKRHRAKGIFSYAFPRRTKKETEKNVYDNSVYKKIRKIVKGLRKIRKIVTQKISFVVIKKQIDKKEIINRHNIGVNYEYAYLTRPRIEEPYEKKIYMNVYVDVSGSISEWDVEIVMRNLIGILKVWQVCLRLYCWSSNENDPQEIMVMKNATLKSFMEEYKNGIDFYSSGGTYLTPVIKHINSREKKADIYLIFTDGYVEPFNELPDLNHREGKKVVFVILGTDYENIRFLPVRKYKKQNAFFVSIQTDL